MGRIVSITTCLSVPLIARCQFTAHQDILEKHILAQHVTGLYNRLVILKVPHALTFCLIRIAHGNSPEEIAKWREERRSKFPTKAVVEEKMARHKELRERGEVSTAC